MTSSAELPAAEGYLEAGGGVRLYFREIGRAQATLIVVHGGPGFSMSYFADDLAPLAERQRIIFYDQRGSGRSSIVSDAAGLHVQRFIDDLDAVRAHFGLERVSLLGHSWGAALVALYAAQHPDHVERLIIVGGNPLRRSELDQAFERLNAERSLDEAQRLRAAREAWAADRGDADLCRAYYSIWFLPFVSNRSALANSRGEFCAGGRAALLNKSNIDAYTLDSLGDFDLGPALAAVAAPALIVRPSADVFADSAPRWAASLADSRLVTLEGAGHFPWLEKPEAFYALIEDFMHEGEPLGRE